MAYSKFLQNFGQYIVYLVTRRGGFSGRRQLGNKVFLTVYLILKVLIAIGIKGISELPRCYSWKNLANTGEYLKFLQIQFRGCQ